MSTHGNPPADDGITLKMVMDHMQHQVAILLKAMQSMEQRLEMKMQNMEHRLDTKMQHMENRLTVQIDGIDQRLDAIEIENLPKRMRRVEKHLKLATV